VRASISFSPDPPHPQCHPGGGRDPSRDCATAARWFVRPTVGGGNTLGWIPASAGMTSSVLWVCGNPILGPPPPSRHPPPPRGRDQGRGSFPTHQLIHLLPLCLHCAIFRPSPRMNGRRCSDRWPGWCHRGSVAAPSGSSCGRRGRAIPCAAPQPLQKLAAPGRQSSHYLLLTRR
jgi:hypothetical protein